MYAFSARHGTRKWSFTTGQDVQSSPAVNHAGTALFVCGCVASNCIDIAAIPQHEDVLGDVLCGVRVQNHGVPCSASLVFSAHTQPVVAVAMLAWSEPRYCCRVVGWLYSSWLAL